MHDDQVDALGLVGQLLDKMVGASRRREEKPDPMQDYRSFDTSSRRDDTGLTL